MYMLIFKKIFSGYEIRKIEDERLLFDIAKKYNVNRYV